jgi:magnesium-transporting ATPase (P-type)
MPLLPVQLLWLNLVTNGIQDIALAGESPEGDELSRAPRRPSEPIFDRLMIRRIWQSSLVMGAGGFAMFYVLLEQGYGESEARNLLLLLFVLFENFQTLASRCASPSSSLAFLPTRFSSSQSQRPRASYRCHVHSDSQRDSSTSPAIIGIINCSSWSTRPPPPG